MGEAIIIRRQLANTQLPARGQVCGAAAIDITPNVGFAMAGYSIEAKKATGLHGRLFARALYLEDAEGHKAALCYVDMMSASRYLLERTASLTAPACGISVDRLLLAGTHTHTAPGHFYGNPLFDAFAQSQSGFDQAWTDWLAEQIATAITQAAEAAEPAQLVVASADLWGISQNRSYAAFAHNFETAATWNQAGYPGQSAPPLPRLRRRAIDPRVTVLVAVARDGACLGAFASFACHATCMGNEVNLYTPDWPGYAVRHAGMLLADEQKVSPVSTIFVRSIHNIPKPRQLLKPFCTISSPATAWI